MSEIAVVDPTTSGGSPDLAAMSLDELAAAATAEHAAAQDAAATTLGHFIRLGEILLAARQRVPDGEWLRWLLDSTGLDGNSGGITKAMRLARYKDHLPATAWQPRFDARGRVAAPSAHNALMYLRGLPDTHSRFGRGRGPAPSDAKPEALRLRAAGLSHEAIAEVVGVTPATVWRWSEPGKAKALDARNKKRKLQRASEQRAATKALREKRAAEEKARLAKAASDEVSKAWGFLRQFLSAADVALRDHTGAVAVALQAAIRHGHLAEGEMQNAMLSEREGS